MKQDDRPVLFLSNTFNTTQRNYSTGDKVGYCNGSEKIKVLFVWKQNNNLGSPNVNFLFRNPSEMSNRQKRWLEFLNQFDIQIVWTQGKNLTMADALSRSHDTQMIFFGVQSNSMEEQMKDQELRDIIDAFNEGCEISQFI